MIHETATVEDGAVVHETAKIWHYAHVRKGAVIGAETVVGKGAFIDHDVVVGMRCKIGNGANLYWPAVIEDGVFIGPSVNLINDRYPSAVDADGNLKGLEDWTPEGVTCRRGSSIGCGAIIMPGVTLGVKCRVGAGALVTKDVAMGQLVYGHPAE